MTFALTIGFGPYALGNVNQHRTFDCYHDAEDGIHAWRLWLGPLAMMVQAGRVRPARRAGPTDGEYPRQFRHRLRAFVDGQPAPEG